MGLRVMRAAVCVTLVALVGGSVLAGGAARGVVVDDVVAPVPIDSPSGLYIVLLDEAPAATYDGGEAGLAPTMPDEGRKLDTHSPAVKEYVAFLEKRQEQIAAQAGVEPLATYQVVLNGFSATMEPDAAARVAAAEGVRAVYPDEIFRPDAVESAGTLGSGATAKRIASAADGGAGVVVGVIDTGIAPENPSFAGERLTAVKSADPYLRGNTIVFDKPDGRQFRSARVTGDEWAKSDYSTKVIGAQSFSAGAIAVGFGFDGDVTSPRDLDGHGSRTASIAAGDGAVTVSVDGHDLGSVSGVASEAKIAAYKACFVGHDPLATTDDVCVGSDVLAALDRAVADGVDVIDYSIGGGAAASAWAADDIAFHNAAVAGVFIAASAGNTGPGPATAQRGAPWYTTVAAATVRAFEATVTLSTGLTAPGVSASVPRGEIVTAPIVYAGDAGLAGAADADLCYLGTLDPARVEGKIVVCDRGTNPRDEKSQEVADAGGVGMILVNVTSDSLEGDFHAVPTVHIDATYRDALIAAGESSAIATLVGEDTTGNGIPAPQIATFSGRGPLLADDGLLSPDVAAPGAAILAATRNSEDGDPNWSVVSGTSIAAAHVAGLAARYLSEHREATPDEIKSALMTTASDTFNADGSANVDPFAQGAGHVDAARLLDPGLLYRSGPAEWADYERERGPEGCADCDILTPELNLPSISIGTLVQESAVTRTLTAARPGTYEVSASIPGVDVTVSPSTLTFDAVGDTAQFTVVFSNVSAPVEVWATGYLTWTGVDGTAVRSPLTVRPATADATALVTGDGVEGSARVAIVAGTTGDLAVDATGLAPLELLVDPEEPAPGHSGDGSSGDANGNVAWVVEVPRDSPHAEFTIAASDDAELGLSVYRLAASDGPQYDRRWTSAASPGQEQRIVLVDPEAGSYLVVADVGDVADEETWDLRHAVVAPRSDSPLSVTPLSLAAVAGSDLRYTLSWSSLRPDAEYVGVVVYGESSVRTVVRIDAGAVAPVAEVAPAITGDSEVGALLTVDPGSWSAEGVVFGYQWMRDGQPISGAAAQDYRVREGDVGTTLSAEVTATLRGAVNPGIARSDGVLVDAASRVDVTMNRYGGTADEQYAVTVVVQTARGEPAPGAVSVHVDGQEFVGTLADGQVTFALPTQAPGIHVVVAEYAGSEGVHPSTGISAFVVRD
jgi:hypothetical protein